MFRRRLSQVLILFFLLWSIAEVFFIRRPSINADNTQPAATRYRERVYIASSHWNHKEILRSNWNNAILQLAKDFGPENLYLSVLESGS
jgi:hypothetical protein